MLLLTGLPLREGCSITGNAPPCTAAHKPCRRTEARNLPPKPGFFDAALQESWPNRTNPVICLRSRESEMIKLPEGLTAYAAVVGAPLRHSVFRRIWTASLLSNFGMLIQGVGAAWAMTEMTHSAKMVALVATA